MNLARDSQKVVSLLPPGHVVGVVVFPHGCCQ